MKNANKKDRIIKHFKRWNIWRKKTLSNRIHIFLVLIGIRKDIYCDITCLPGELDQWKEKQY